MSPTNSTSESGEFVKPTSSVSDAEIVESDLELMLSRVIDATPERIYQVWTLRLKEWWAPHSMTTTVLEMDLRAGGAFQTLMRSADGTEYPCDGVFLEVVPNQRIVFTDAYHRDWSPNPDLFFTAVVSLDPLPGGRTRYTARALHWTEEKRDEHEKMGFYPGWSECIDQLEALVLNG